MKIRLFGRDLFEEKSTKADQLIGMAMKGDRESKYLPDFYTMRDNNNEWFEPLTMISTQQMEKLQEPKAEEKVDEKLTPKGIYRLKLLHDEAFRVNMSTEYVDSQLADFKDKLAVIKAEEFDMSRGANEIASMVIRLENRKKYTGAKETFEEYPYTTPSRIAAVLKDHDNLKIGHVAQFIADMPREATAAMKRYNAACKALCGKQAVFYVVADKKDFKKTDQRRDPILLAQSPFGHFWQILGAWDEEMLLLENL